MILGLIQARFSSTRLPGKVLKPILGKPMLYRQIERIRRATKLDRLIIVTSVDSSDDALAAMARETGIEVYRGSLNDVLDRFYQAALPVRPDFVVRLTGDCPLIDPVMIDELIDFHIQGRFDYSGNSIEPTYPDGLDVEMMTFDALARAWREARLPSEREHVTPYLQDRPEVFKVGSLKGKVDLSAHRWTVDEPADFELVRRVYEALYPTNANFSSSDIFNLIEREPELARLNSNIIRNEGYLKSLESDKENG